MSDNSKHGPGNGKNGDEMTVPEAADRRENTDYEVGYGKPPKHTRFLKGQSGNPRGRPRKPKPRPMQLSDAPLDSFLEMEAYRKIGLRENGQAIELPAIQAVLWSLVTGAIKGKQLSQKYLLEFLGRTEDLHFKQKVDRYHRLRAEKRDGERVLAEYQRDSLPSPNLLPHPDDIVLYATSGESYITGPETQEDVRCCEHSMRLRDHYVLRSAHAADLNRKISAKTKDNGHCNHMIYAHLLDLTLPSRYRWQDDAEFRLFWEFKNLSKREREQRIAAERADLSATKPRSSRVTPEMEREVDRSYDKWFKRRKNSD